MHQWRLSLLVRLIFVTIYRFFSFLCFWQNTLLCFEPYEFDVQTTAIHMNAWMTAIAFWTICIWRTHHSNMNALMDQMIFHFEPYVFNVNMHLTYTPKSNMNAPMITSTVPLCTIRISRTCHSNFNVPMGVIIIRISFWCLTNNSTHNAVSKESITFNLMYLTYTQ